MTYWLCCTNFTLDDLQSTMPKRSTTYVIDNISKLKPETWDEILEDDQAMRVDLLDDIFEKYFR